MDFFKCIAITFIHQFINNGAFLGLYTELKSGWFEYIILKRFVSFNVFIFLMNSIIVQN